MTKTKSFWLQKFAKQHFHLKMTNFIVKLSEFLSLPMMVRALAT